MKEWNRYFSLVKVLGATGQKALHNFHLFTRLITTWYEVSGLKSGYEVSAHLRMLSGFP